MLKPTVKRGLMLDFIPDVINCAAVINPNRVNKLNSKDILDGDIFYIMSREFRLEDNWAVIFALELVTKYNKNFKIVIFLDKKRYSEAQELFLNTGVNLLKENLLRNNINFEISNKVPSNAGAIVVDFNPLYSNIDIAKTSNCAVFEVDSHNIIPARFISDKQEFSAATLRRKIYGNIADFLTEFPLKFDIIKSESLLKLNDFVKNKLDIYSEAKNNPNKNATSNLSPYLHFGFISAQRIVLEIIKSSSTRENKETFLEELIVRKELSDNFCLYSKGYKNFDGILDWAKSTLNSHRYDIRSYTYTLEEFERSKTHDEFWNAIQNNLRKIGKIHGYLRMYWAKKILEWSSNPEEALKIAIYLNDTYALDGNDPNGYVGILWAIGGLHDRAFANRLVTGKIRYMSFGGCRAKFDVTKYIRNSL